MREALGSAEDSNPKEIKAIKTHLEEIGVSLIRTKAEKLSYSPGLSKGQPGTVYISENASYGAWFHELRHAEDEQKTI